MWTETPLSDYPFLLAVQKERERQEELKKAGKFLWSCADNFVMVSGQERHITEAEKGVVLGEEFGEAMREVTDAIIALDKQDFAQAESNLSSLRKELIQVAAVAVAWVESLDARGIK